MQVSYLGRALRHASPELRGNKHFILQVIKLQSAWGSEALKFVSSELKNDKEVVLAAIQRTGEALEHASLELRNDKQVAIAAVENQPRAIEFASTKLKNDKELILIAVAKDGLALEYASLELRNNKQVAMTAVANEPFAIQYISPKLRNDKEVTLLAIAKEPDSIKYTGENIKRDHEALIAAGMFDAYHDEGAKEIQKIRRRSKKIVLSTRFSLDTISVSEATRFTSLLKKHEYIEKGNFKVYSPNAFEKKTCDPNWTDFDHPCRGTLDACTYDNKFTQEGRPTNDCCWRHSFRYQLEEAKETGGFMLQLVETAWELGLIGHAKLGKGQAIEQDMAEQLGLKIFHVYRPAAFGVEQKFGNQSIMDVVSIIECWYANRCQDMSLCVIDSTQVSSE
eukprot:CAMPEP_0178916832 /NCGR_PEP_ID=MMETSP0786-20121207/12887_1 /TAXON_ID=186022 /ORGANISM="Thalassionema frauenfeldii, Strain CCMP 1798" /LENGTH=393 /DNA_ID=CAMNT_0020590269 /DNA_START=232 /DNA_END=1413 /DNA_ORIENTATION=-